MIVLSDDRFSYLLLGSIVEVFTDGGTELSGLFFQDSLMASAIALFPEVLSLDATYKLNILRMLLYVSLAVDDDGQSKIVAICVTSNETRTGLKTLVDSFKRNNPCWVDTGFLLTDKDITEREVLKYKAFISTFIIVSSSYF